ncbi:MAG: hypothetical protein RRY34_06390 [Victivallaceae bacterium]
MGNGLAICALVFSLICGLVGLILAIIGLTKYPAGSSGKTMCIIAVVLAGINMLVGVSVSLNQ